MLGRGCDATRQAGRIEKGLSILEVGMDEIKQESSAAIPVRRKRKFCVSLEGIRQESVQSAVRIGKKRRFCGLCQEIRFLDTAAEPLIFVTQVFSFQAVCSKSSLEIVYLCTHRIGHPLALSDHPTRQYCRQHPLPIVRCSDTATAACPILSISASVFNATAVVRTKLGHEQPTGDSDSEKRQHAAESLHSKPHVPV